MLFSLILASILTLILYCILGIPFVIFIQLLASLPEYTGRTSFVIEPMIATLLIFAVVFVWLRHIRLSKKNHNALNLYEVYENKPYRFIDDLKLILTEEKKVFLWLTGATLVCHLIVGFLMLLSPKPFVISTFSLLTFPFSGLSVIVWELTGVINAVFVCKAIFTCAANILLLNVFYIGVLALVRHRWYIRFKKNQDLKEHY